MAGRRQNLRRSRLTRGNLGFLLAKASQQWNAMLYEGFCEQGFAQVRPSFGSVLLPLFEEDGLRIGELALRSKLSKQTMTTMVRLVERAKLVITRPDPQDGRVTRVYLTEVARRFAPAAERVLAGLERRAVDLGGREAFNSVGNWLRRFAQM
jgi:DNA-binding MarR family transcriptional regulator